MGDPGRLTGGRPMGRGTFTGRQLNAVSVRLHVRTVSLIVTLLLASSCAAAEPNLERLDSFRLGIAYERAIQEHFSFALSRTLAFRFLPGQRVQSPEYAVTFIDQTEYPASGVSLKRTYRVEVVVAAAPVLHQLGDLLAAAPHRMVPDLLREIKVQRYDLFDSDCPAITASYEAFSAAASGALEANESGVSFYHGPSYVVEGYSEHISFLVSVHPENTLYSWAARTYASLMECTN